MGLVKDFGSHSVTTTYISFVVTINEEKNLMQPNQLTGRTLFKQPTRIVKSFRVIKYVA